MYIAVFDRSLVLSLNDSAVAGATSTFRALHMQSVYVRDVFFPFASSKSAASCVH